MGTTDIPVDKPVLDARPLAEELEFLIGHTGRILNRQPTESDVLASFAGLRPLVKAGDSANTSKLSRNHRIVVSRAGLVTITGGKWTTYRKMAEDTVNRAQQVGSLGQEPCRTRSLRLHGYQPTPDRDSFRRTYGGDLLALDELAKSKPAWNEPLHPRLPYRPAEVIWAVRHEMAHTLDDVLARRTRATLLDAQAAREIAPAVAKLMAKELGHKAAWVKKQVATLNG